MLAGHTDYVHAVDGVSFDIRRGEVFGLAVRAAAARPPSVALIIGLERADRRHGRISTASIWHRCNADELRRMRRRMQVIFQDPMASLNPRMTLGEAIMHGLKIHFPERAAEHRDLVMEMMEHGRA